MSEEGWRTFLAAEGVDDWVVLHGGATAAFQTDSMGDAASLAGAIADVPGVADAGAVLTIAGTRVTVRLTRDMWFLEPHHVDLARAISGVARSAGATPEPESVQEVQVAVASKPDAVDLAFWRAVLGYAPMSPDNAIDPLGHGSTVWAQELDAAKLLRHAMHVDVSVGKGQGPARLAAALAAGGRVVAESQEHWTLSDRAGNRVCIAVWPDGDTTGSGTDDAA
jgi:4a-hydroxytetrahydrobiopterin dehydratase